MRLPPRFLARVGRRLTLGRPALARRLRRGRATLRGGRLDRARLAVGRGLGRGPLGALARRLGQGPLGALARRLGQGRVVAAAVALAAAATAVGIGVGASDHKTKGSPVPPVAARPAAAGAVVPVAAVPKRVARRDGRRPRRGGAAHYRRTARNRVPAKTPAAFLPLYREAERAFGVNWRLIASIHRQETAFSTSPGTYHGLNAYGCCAGPMQFNVKNGPVSTWERYRNAYRSARRPKRYPHRTRSHPSIYDDFDAIMAAGSLLSDSGAGSALDSGAWFAAYSYYGHDLFGVTYASQVLARAEAWQRDGFCPNCELDEGLVAEFESSYGEPVRRHLLAEERRRKKHKKRKHDRDRKADRRARRKDARRDRRTTRRSPAGARPPSRRPAKRRPIKPAPVPEPLPPYTTPVPPPSPPAEQGCAPPVDTLLGC